MKKHTGTLFVFLAALLYSIGGLCITVGGPPSPWWSSGLIWPLSGTGHA